MSELIDRQAALEKVRAMQTYKLFMGDDMILVDKAEVQTELMMLPTVQPEPTDEQVEEYCKKRCLHVVTADFFESTKPQRLGHWIKHIDPFDGEQYECSECGVLWEFNDGTPEDNEAYFCPKCGARMKGEI